MKNTKILKLLDYVPLVILTFLAIAMFSWEYEWVWPNYVALGFILFACYCFYHNHQLGVIAILVLLLLGLFGVVRLSPGTTTFILTLGKTNPTTLYMPGMQPQYLLGLTLHLLISRRYYFGIASKAYWVSFGEQLKKKDDNNNRVI